VRIEQGHLVIEARQENYIGADGMMTDYTSGRIKTQNLFTQQYGRFEARMKVPSGKGISPAFWMEGENKPFVGWPRCGEIDIMEDLGRTPDSYYSTLHGPGFLSDSKLQAFFSIGQGKSLSDDYHVYAVDWSRTEVVFTLDGIPYGRIVRDTPEHGRDIPLDQPFFIILSMAIIKDPKGGPATQPGQLPAQLDVDYVRVYQRQ
jgi:beta-glucanase (GH16 family)